MISEEQKFIRKAKLYLNGDWIQKLPDLTHKVVGLINKVFFRAYPILKCMSFHHIKR